jgi:UDP-4-amino-4,6-dideoxy-N-acetyl-beta-L-altrosamine transaminase
MIPYGKQDINQQDIEAVLNVLKSDFLTQGPQVPAFEKAVTSFTGAKYALAMNSATSALHVACLALGVKEGDYVWTSPITFVASANCALYCGANIDFVDIDEKTYNMSPISLEEKLIEAKKKNKLPKVVIPVHLCGQPCDMKAIKKLSNEYGFKIIEDASHAIGGKYLGKPIGCGEFSDITIFSFHPVKIITTAEGGMALTNSDELNTKMSLLRSHGITRDEKQMTHKPDGPWYYQQIELGYNYRMTELQAALGLSQMSRLVEFVDKRHLLAKRYNEKLTNLPLILPYQLENTYSGLHLYVIKLELNKIKKTHLEVFNFLKEKGIGVNLHYIPVHTQPYYKKLGFKEGSFKKAEDYYSAAISIPMYSGLSFEDQDKVIATIKEALIGEF